MKAGCDTHDLPCRPRQGSLLYLWPPPTPARYPSTPPPTPTPPPLPRLCAHRGRVPGDVVSWGNQETAAQGYGQSSDVRLMPACLSLPAEQQLLPRMPACHALPQLARPPCGPPGRFTMIIFVLISGPLGWATTIFLGLAALVLLVLNMKLFVIIRCARASGPAAGPGSAPGGQLLLSQPLLQHACQRPRLVCVCEAAQCFGLRPPVHAPFPSARPHARPLRTRLRAGTCAAAPACASSAPTFSGSSAPRCCCTPSSTSSSSAHSSWLQR